MLHGDPAEDAVLALGDEQRVQPRRGEVAITPRTAIMPVHPFSQMTDVAALRQLADRYGLALLG